MIKYRVRQTSLWRFSIDSIEDKSVILSWLKFDRFSIYELQQLCNEFSEMNLDESELKDFLQWKYDERFNYEFIDFEEDWFFEWLDLWNWDFYNEIEEDNWYKKDDSFERIVESFRKINFIKNNDNLWNLRLTKYIIYKSIEKLILQWSLFKRRLIFRFNINWYWEKYWIVTIATKILSWWEQLNEESIRKQIKKSIWKFKFLNLSDCDVNIERDNLEIIFKDVDLNLEYDETWFLKYLDDLDFLIERSDFWKSYSILKKYYDHWKWVYSTSDDIRILLIWFKEKEKYDIWQFCSNYRVKWFMKIQDSLLSEIKWFFEDLEKITS